MNLKCIFLLFTIILLNVDLYSQENFFSYEKVKVEEIPSIEKKFNSRVYNSKMEHGTMEKDKVIKYGKPKIYRREMDKHLDVVDVIYYYLENDTIAKRITYTWSNPENSKLKDFSRMFDKTIKKISADLDLPIGEQGKQNKIIDDTVNGIPVERTERRVTWKYNTTKILVLMIWTETHGAYLATTIDWE